MRRLLARALAAVLLAFTLLTVTAVPASADTITGNPWALRFYLGPYGYYPAWCAYSGTTLNVLQGGWHVNVAISVVSAADPGGGACNINVRTTYYALANVQYRETPSSGVASWCEVTWNNYSSQDGRVAANLGCLSTHGPGWYRLYYAGVMHPIYGSDVSFDWSSPWVYAT